LRVQSLSPDIIDINLGCPAETVTDVGAGVSLMRTPFEGSPYFRQTKPGAERAGDWENSLGLGR
jgi:hypothetical protein